MDTLFILLLGALAMVAGFCYLWIKIQVWKTGDRHNFLSLSHDSHLFRRYRVLATQNCAPMWPLRVYWLAVFACLVAGFGAIVTLHR